MMSDKGKGKPNFANTSKDVDYNKPNTSDYEKSKGGHKPNSQR